MPIATLRLLRLRSRCALRAAVLIASTSALSTSQAQQSPPESVAKAEAGSTDANASAGKRHEGIIMDFDGDGWDDLWTAQFPEIKTRDTVTDTDGDGMSDYEEMVRGRNPIVKGPVGPPPTAEEIAAGQKAAAEARVAAERAWQEKKIAAAPRLRPLIAAGERQPAPLKARAEKKITELRAQAERSRAEQPAKERALDDLARKYGVPREQVDAEGRKLLLSGEVGGAPVFIGSFNTLAAAGIGADELWPAAPWWPYAEAGTGLNLTGAGQTLGMWEVDGGVRTSHLEFGARVIQKDAAALDNSGHASQVAGTMAAAGVGSILGNFYEARGVAYQAGVFAYSTANFKTEREAAAAGSASDPAVLASNHSWGVTNGWRQESFDAGSGPANHWVWYGVPNAGFTEDFKFGFYYPNLGDETGCTQIDRFLQAEAPHHLMVFACGNDRGEGPGVSPGTYYYRTGQNSYQAVSAAAFPRVWSDGDAGGYDTVAAPGTAKNVLTVGACEDVYRISSGVYLLGYGPGANATPASFSGAGPTDDGRIKPDLVAVGTTNTAIRQVYGLSAGAGVYGLISPTASGDLQYTGGAIGTSFAAPAVTGGLGLVLERRAQLYPSLTTADAWLNSTLKALAIETCDDVGAPGPDYRMGHGIFNARSAVLLVDADHAAGRGSHLKEFTLAPTESVSWVVRSDGTAPLSATLAWSDPAGPALTTITGADAPDAMLVNNLDLKIDYLGPDTVSSPGPTAVQATYLPWVLNPDLAGKTAAARSAAATRGVDNRNNVEKVSLVAPPAGRYRVTVSHAGGLPGNPAASVQAVSVALSGSEPEMARITELAASPTASEYLLSFAADPGAYFLVEESADLASWTTAGTVLAEQVANTVLVTVPAGQDRHFWRLRRAP